MSASTYFTRASTTKQRLERRSLHSEAVDMLGRRIVSGDFPDGAALPIESDLGAELDVSRTVVREAVRVLAAKGLVSTRPRTGTRVRPRSSWDVIDRDVIGWIVHSGPSRAFYENLFEVRTIVEPQAAALAAERRTELEAAKIVTLLERLELAADDRRAHIEADLPLHAAILEASHNELLLRLSSTLGVALRAGRDVTTRVTEGLANSIRLHRNVVSAIVEARPERAHAAMLALIADAHEDMEAVLAEVAVGSPELEEDA